MSDSYHNELINLGYAQGYRDGERKGRADKYKEIISEYMLLTEKQVDEIRADAIEEFVIAYIKDEEQYDGCQGCERTDDYCCIQCFRDRYLEQLKSQNSN